MQAGSNAQKPPSATWLAWILRTTGVVLLDRRRVTVGGRTWLAGILLAGLGGFLVFNHPGLSQLYFLHYGVVAGAILGAWALIVRSCWPLTVVSVSTCSSQAVLATGAASHSP